MKIQCPFNPQHTIEFGANRCKKCRRPITLSEVMKTCRRKVKWSLLLSCPNCEWVQPVSDPKCARCGFPITVHNWVRTVCVTIWSSILESAKKASPTGIRRFQRIYLLLSSAAVWALALYLGNLEIEDLTQHLQIAAAFTVAAFIVSKIVFSGNALVFIRDNTSGIVKLGLLFNFVFAFLLLVIAIGIWNKAFTILACTIVALFAGAWIFCGYAWPLAAEVYCIFFGTNSQPADPIARQGRTPRYED